jgi:hypothetical protein
VSRCAHNLRAVPRRLESETESAVKILVNGRLAHTIEDARLKLYDLALLGVPQVHSREAKLRKSAERLDMVSCEGFVPFIHKEYAHEIVKGEVKDRSSDPQRGRYCGIVF